jgi:uncharacterized protein YqfA (UPF0365 family)
VIVRALSSMSSEERRDLLVSVVDRMLSQMSADERRSLMEHVVDHFLDTLPNEERASVVRELVPRLMSQLMKSGDMSVDDLLWTAMGSLGALEQGHQGGEGPNPQT